MASLRFTPDEYDAITRACRTLRFDGSFAVFQRSLADAVREGHPALAGRIAGLGKGCIRVLSEYLECHKGSGGCRGSQGRGEQVRAGHDLSVREWQALAQACALVWLHNDSLPPDKGSLLQQVAVASPTLSERLGRLSDGQFARLCLALKSGRRCFAP